MRADSERADPGYRDITCSFCGRHNRVVHMVGGADGLTICSVCVARCAEILDQDTGVTSPAGGWSGRWPAKQVAPAASGPGSAGPAHDGPAPHPAPPRPAAGHDAECGS